MAYEIGRKVIEAKTQDIEGVSVGQKYQKRNVFTSNRGNNKKISLKSLKFQKRSLEVIFSKTYLFSKIL